MTSRSWSVALLVAALCAGSGCVRVRAHQRETLARPDMVMGGAPESTAGEQHARAYREGSMGGAEVSSGGCGCN
ncbi:MAG: DUF4266 domain-containing protein [Kofleriaceae bacterium]|nr:DUF4266 domain-containing protein [Kofleriaceae bacterium]MBP6841257.1 DUF4266 domain-containing protein [Kofleriaceae bacterium]MBP9205630.1 DUF4266 domain-containing protein [Kofleriaceae bacterium]